MSGDKKSACKRSLYFTPEALQEIREEAARLDRSVSWVVTKAVKLAMAEIRKLPGSTKLP